MMKRMVLLWMIALSAAAHAQPNAACPWLTEGTAAKVLGGEVTVTAQSSGNWDGSCRFTSGMGSSRQKIDIQIGKVNTHPCPQGSTIVSALGNEAMRCQVIGPQNEPAAIIAGRVRDAFFVVSMVNVPGALRDPPATGHPPSVYGAAALEMIAGQVVGNLY
jgi:hypothetical protein